MNKRKLVQMLDHFFMEDIGEGDATSNALFNGDEQGHFTFVAKEAGIFCGNIIIETGFRMLDHGAQIEQYVYDGEEINPGDRIAHIKGTIPALLAGERVILNLVQRMSGIASLANEAVKVMEGTKTIVCDTRKTTPGLRMFEKYAVRCGGAKNHRLGLYDGVMIKDNHIDFAGGVTKAIEMVKEKVGHMVRIEVEASSLEQAIEAAEAGADIIMFDNCRPEEIREMIDYLPGHVVTEASGGITIDRLHEYRESGVDYISLGCLTHSAKALDISAKVVRDINKEEAYGNKH
ncbi:MAG: carboxylating nicotinate-nucleotide diphosphorylase [Bacillus sp. (in: firmicutes)]